MKINIPNGLYNVAAGIVKVGLGVLTIPIMIQQLGVELYGLWALVTSIIGILNFAESGLSVATSVFVAQDIGSNDKKKLNFTVTAALFLTFFLSTVIAVALYYAVEPITNSLFHLTSGQQKEVEAAFYISTIAVWSRLIQQALIGIEQAHQRYDLTSFTTISSSIFLFSGMILIVLLKGEILELAEWQSLVSAATLIVHLILVARLLRKEDFHFAFSLQRGIEIFRYSIMIWLTSLGCVIFSRGDRVIVGNLAGVQVLGAYAAITDILSQINNLSALPIQPLVPFVSELFGTKNPDRLKLYQKVTQSLKVNSISALGLGLGFVALTPEILNMLFHQVSTDYQIGFIAATLIYSVYSLNAVGYYMLTGMKLMRQCTIIVVSSGFLSLLLIAYGTYKLHLIGALFGNLGYIATLLLLFAAFKSANVPFIFFRPLVNFLLLWILFILLNIVLLAFNANPIFRYAALLGEEILMVMYWVNPNYHYALE
jgi:O-antigen/teichoic acid export membrane protein